MCGSSGRGQLVIDECVAERQSRGGSLCSCCVVASEAVPDSPMLVSRGEDSFDSFRHGVYLGVVRIRTLWSCCSAYIF